MYDRAVCGRTAKRSNAFSAT
jgi:secreted trypsin-like serine protease